MSYCQSHEWKPRWMPKDGKLRPFPKANNMQELLQWDYDSVCIHCGTTSDQWNQIAKYGYALGRNGQEREWFWSTRFALGEAAARPPGVIA